MPGHLPALGVVIAIALATLMKSLWNGKLRSALEERRNDERDANSAHDKINRDWEGIHDQLDRIEDNQGAMYDEMGTTQRAILVLHQDDDNVDEEALREMFGIQEMADDILIDDG